MDNVRASQKIIGTLCTLVVGTVFGGCSAGATEALESAAAGLSSSLPRTVMIQNASSNECFDVPGGTTDPTTMQQWMCGAGNLNQQFDLLRNSDATYSIRNQRSGLCLDISGSSTADGAPLLQWPCSGHPNQEFELQPATNGTYSVVSRASGKCVDIPNASTSDGTLFQQWTCYANSAQLYKLIDTGGGGPTTPPPPPPLTPTAPLPTGVAGNWTLKFSDEFDGASLDTSKWNTDMGWTKNWDLAYLDASALSVGGGQIDLRVDNRPNGGLPYTGGMIMTRDKYTFTYGVAEARIQIPQGASVDAGFWMVPGDGSWPPEIDVVELLTQTPTYPIMTNHWSANGTSSAQPFYYASQASYADDMHTFTVKWQPDSITWYIDGVQRAQYTDRANISSQPMYLIVDPHVCAGGTWCGADMSQNQFPMHMRVDYVRVWQ